MFSIVGMWVTPCTTMVACLTIVAWPVGNYVLYTYDTNVLLMLTN